MCSSNFDWSIEIMDPGRSLQKEHEETPGTNWFAGRQLAADYPVPGLLLISSVLFERSMCPWRSGRGSFQISEVSWLERKSF